MNIDKKILNLVKNQVKLIFENDLLLEADYKKKILSKFPLPESTAEYISLRLGKLSLWFLNALEKEAFDSKEDFIKYINERPFWIRSNYDNTITKILDWLRHPLMTGTRVELRNLTLPQAIEKSDEFHEQLESIGGTIDYDEKNEKVVQYDNGFYWIKIPSNYSDEECKRMGHCGRTNKGDTLFSLRSNEPFKNNHTINRSYVTVAYNSNDGIIYQSKSFKNKKPENQFFPYFYDLIMRLPKFEGLGKEYQKDEDIDYEDFTVEELRSVYQKFPNAFKSYNNQKLLFQKGIIDKLEEKGTFTLSIKPEDLIRYLKTDYKEKYFVEVLMGDVDSHNFYYKEAWKHWTDDVNKDNKQKIFNYIKNTYPDINIENGNLEEILKDNEDELTNVIWSINDAYANATSDTYVKYFLEELESSLSAWGEVLKLDDEGAEIEIDPDYYFENVDSEDLDDAYQRCDDDRECAFNELLANGQIEPPRFYIDSRYDPYPESENFNYHLQEALSSEGIN